MNRVERLIAELCPDGAEFKPLSDVTVKSKKINWNECADEKFSYIDLGAVDKVTHQIYSTESITSCNAPSRAQFIVETGDVIFATTRPMQMRWAVVPQKYGGQIASTGFSVLRPILSKILPNYLAHSLGTNAFSRYVENNQVHGNYPSIPDKRVRAYQIPVPPLEVQREIVKVLDRFTQLEAELEARSLQYEYYRDKLLTSESARWSTLGEAFIMKAGKAVRRSEISPSCSAEYPFPVFGGNGVRGYIDRASNPGGSVLVGRQGALCGNVSWSSGDFYATEHAIVVNPRGQMERRWIFHMLKVMKLSQFATKSAQPGLSVERLKSVPIPIPSLENQKRIASVLDKFDVLVNDINVGIPAEIAARRKQYEYYRDKLLTFKELS